MGPLELSLAVLVAGGILGLVDEGRELLFYEWSMLLKRRGIQVEWKRTERAFAEKPLAMLFESYISRCDSGQAKPYVESILHSNLTPDFTSN